jgi:hypothetical protein
MSGVLVLTPTVEDTSTVTEDPRAILARKLKYRKEKSLTANKEGVDAIQKPLSMIESKDQLGMLENYLQLPMPTS